MVSVSIPYTMIMTYYTHYLQGMHGWSKNTILFITHFSGPQQRLKLIQKEDTDAPSLHAT